jgi:hypothetical protein
MLLCLPLVFHTYFSLISFLKKKVFQPAVVPGRSTESSFTSSVRPTCVLFPLQKTTTKHTTLRVSKHQMKHRFVQQPIGLINKWSYQVISRHSGDIRWKLYNMLKLKRTVVSPWSTKEGTHLTLLSHFYLARRCSVRTGTCWSDGVSQRMSR